MFDSPLKLLLGFITGLAFGVFLQKGRVAKHSVIVGQLILRDFSHRQPHRRHVCSSSVLKHPASHTSLTS